MMLTFVKKIWGYMKPVFASFFHGLFWPFTWLESKVASLGLLVALFLIIAVASGAGLIAVSLFPYSGSSDTASGSGEEGNSDTCNVVGIEIRDCLMTYMPDDTSIPSISDSCYTVTASEDVVWSLENAATNEQIKAVVLEIDSTGGSPAAAEEIAAAVKAVGKPVIAWVRGSADSAAYWVASSADTIIAGANSDVGSIGVTSSYVDNARQNLKDGLTYNQLTTGKYKDTGTVDRALTADERSLIQRDLNIILQNFINAVATNRHLSVAKVTALADGSTMLGQMALQNGLIDQVGTKQEVWQRLEVMVGDKPDVCWN